jgi:putative zinc finger/helix-turn-helix YgiT family protein
MPEATPESLCLFMKKARMSETMPCSRCGTVRDVELIEREEKVTIKGREVTFHAQFYKCVTCGEEFEVPGQLDRNLDAAREAYARLYEKVEPGSLVALREKYGASQKAFGLILGFGELTMNSYERGATPTSTNRLLLRLAENPIHFRVMYDLNKERIGAIQRQRIETSDAFKSAKEWAGLEALASELTAIQREKIETCAASYSKSIIQQVVGYVNTGSLQEYSQLMRK